MESFIMKQASRFLREQKNNKNWHKVMVCLAAIVVVGVAAALTMPGQALTHKVKLLDCHQEVHQHTADCLNEKGDLVCGYADYLIHAHNEDCYDADGNLVCTLPEVYPHEHAADCYDENGALVCGYTGHEIHRHTASCYDENGVLVCHIPEAELHEHTDDCYEEIYLLICGEGTEDGEGDGAAESAQGEMQNGESDDLMGKDVSGGDGEAAPHVHTEECYEVVKVLTCGKVALHTHGEGCYDENGDLICGLEELREHVHSQEEGCFKIVEQEVEESAETESAETESTEALETESAETGETLSEEDEVDGATVNGVQSEEDGMDGATVDGVQSGEDEMGGEVVDGVQPEEDEMGGEVDNGVQSSVEGEQAPESGETAGNGIYVWDGGAADEGNSAGDGPELFEENIVSGGDWASERSVSDSDNVSYTMTANEVPYVLDEETNNLKFSLYREKEDGSWELIEGNTLPEDILGEHVKISVSFENVPKEELLQRGCTITYNLPDVFKDAAVSGDVVSGGEKVGRIEVKDGQVVLTLDPEWVAKQETNIQGSFDVVARFDLKEVEESRPGGTLVGDYTIEIGDDTDIYAKYSDVDIEKGVKYESTLVEGSDGKKYLEYTVTVTGGEYDVEDVVITDTITEGAEFVVRDGEKIYKNCNEASSYQGDEDYESGTITEQNGALTWNIPKLKAGETRTLTYRVEVTDDFVDTGIDPGFHASPEQPPQPHNTVTNKASVTTPKREDVFDETTSEFSPNANVNMAKDHMSENGVTLNMDEKGYFISYVIWMQAGSDNSDVLHALKLFDSLTELQGTPTDSALLPYLHYDENSFELQRYNENGEIEETKPLGVVKEGAEPTEGQILLKKDGEGNVTGFIYEAGDLAPGEKVQITYKLRIDPEVFADINTFGNPLHIGNAGIVEDKFDTPVQRFQHDVNLEKRTWAEKQDGVRQDEAGTIQMDSDKVVDQNGNVIAEAPESFEYPAGSYLYHVTANAEGVWDVSSAVMKDELDQTHMKFVGYVRVDATYTNEDGTQNTETVWVKVDGENKFALTPDALGLPEGPCSYELSYYAVPVNMEGVTHIVVDNTFSMGGDVYFGNDGTKHQLTGVTANGSATVEGSTGFTAEKMAWYFDDAMKPAEAEQWYTNGAAMYWVLAINATGLPEGLKIKDELGSDNQVFRGDALVGAYLANEKIDFEKYQDYEEFAQNFAQNYEASLLNGRRKESAGGEGTGGGTDGGEGAEPDVYEWSLEDGGKSLFIQILRELKPDKEKENLYLYFIVRSDVTKVPVKDASETYMNDLLTGEDEHLIPDGGAQYTKYGSEAVSKEVYGVHVWDEEKGQVTDIAGSSISAGNFGLFRESGLYVSWSVKVNTAKNLKGTITVVDTLPPGLVLSGIRAASPDKNSEYIPKAAEPEAAFFTGEEGSWDSRIGINDMIQGEMYYTKLDEEGNQTVCWALDFGEGGKETVDFRVVCRVTDPEILQGGVEKELTNQVTIYSGEDLEKPFDQDNATVEIQPVESLSKEMLETPTDEAKAGEITFYITVNELNADLGTEDGTITVIDEMNAALTFNPDSIKVYRADGITLEALKKLPSEEKEVYELGEEEWTYQFGPSETAGDSGDAGTVVKVTVPDDQKLYIEYTTRVYVAPGVQVSLSNIAHYEGRQAPQSSTVTKEDFTYEAAGQILGQPQITITKVDASDGKRFLPGAEFDITEVARYNEESGVFESISDPQVIHAETDEQGKAVIASGLELNTIYRLEETIAPAGYKKDDIEKYVIFIKDNEVAGKLENVGYNVDVVNVYADANYSVSVLNTPYRISVNKSFIDGQTGQQLYNYIGTVNGTYWFGLYEMGADDTIGDLVETVSIVVSGENGSSFSATFKTHLSPEKTYGVYELDGENGNPIESSGRFYLNGELYQVGYGDGRGGNGNTNLSIEQGDVQVTVSNTWLPQYELPKTGSIGTAGFTAGGLTLMSLGALFLVSGIVNRRRRKRP